MKTLYDIADDLKALSDLLDEMGGDVTDEQVDDAVESWFDEIYSNLKTKLKGYSGLIKNHELLAKGYREEASRFAGKASVSENIIRRLKARLNYFFETQKLDKVETGTFTVSRRKNGGALPIYIEQRMQDFPEELPEGFRRVVFEPDKIAMRKYLETGKELEFAVLGERGSHIRIK